MIEFARKEKLYMSYEQKIIRCTNLLSNELKTQLNTNSWMPINQTFTARFFNEIYQFHWYFEWFVEI